VDKMLKSPWRKDMSIRYFELFKIAIIAFFLVMGFSLFLENTVVFSSASPLMQSIVYLVMFAQIVLVNYELFKWIIMVVRLSISDLIHFNIPPLKCLIAYKSIEKSILLYTIKPYLKHCVIRV
jgi:hypothetical protein